MTTYQLWIGADSIRPQEPHGGGRVVLMLQTLLQHWDNVGHVPERLNDFPHLAGQQGSQGSQGWRSRYVGATKSPKASLGRT